MKKLGRIPLLLLVILLLSNASSLAAPSRVWVMTGPNTSEYNVVKTIADRWNALHPDKQVDVQMSAGSEDVLKVAIVAGQAPDIYTAMASGPYVGFAKDGFLTNFNELPGFNDLIAARSFGPIITDYTYAGQNFVIPWQTEVLLYEYNIDMLNNIGVGKFPSCYSDFYGVCDKLTQFKRGCIELHLNTTWNERIADYYLHYLAASGGRTLIERRRATFNSPVGIATLQFLVEAYRRSYPLDDVIGGDLFISGYMLTKRWGQAATSQFNEAGFSWGAAPAPVPDDYSGPQPPYTFMNMKHIVMPFNAKNQQNAWAFLKFMLEPENDRVLLDSGRFPVRTDLGTHRAFADWFRKNPQGLQFANHIGRARDLDQIANLVEIYEAFSEHFINAILGRIAPHIALEQAADAVNRLVF